VSWYVVGSFDPESLQENVTGILVSRLTGLALHLDRVISPQLYSGNCFFMLTGSSYARDIFSSRNLFKDNSAS
jgi:hypothetical protein